MAENFYLILDGIQGDSKRNGLENSIECNGLYHDIAQSRSESAAGTSRTSGSVAHSVISIVKRIDRATTSLIDTCNLGELIQSGRIEFHSGGGNENQTKYYKITLGGVRVNSVRTEQLNNLFLENGDMPPIERVTLSYDTIEWTFYPRDPDGSTGNPIETNFDVTQNKKV